MQVLFLSVVKQSLCCCGFQRLLVVSKSEVLSDVVVALSVLLHAYILIMCSYYGSLIFDDPDAVRLSALG